MAAEKKLIHIYILFFQKSLQNKIVPSLYSRKASAFFAICSVSAFALAAIANASASPRIFI